jgi:hypothetical protein
MKSERWLKLYRDSVIRENVRIGNGIAALTKKSNPDEEVKIELTPEEQHEVDAMRQAQLHNYSIITFLDFALQDDDPSEITADDVAGEVLYTILTHRTEFIGFSEDAFKSIYQFRVPYGATAEAFGEILLNIANNYCAQYGVEIYDAGDGIVSLVRYKSELQHIPTSKFQEEEKENESSR